MVTRAESRLDRRDIGARQLSIKLAGTPHEATGMGVWWRATQCGRALARSGVPQGQGTGHPPWPGALALRLC